MKKQTVEQRLYRYYTIGSMAVILISLTITLYFLISLQQSELDGTIASMAAVVANTPMVIETVEGNVSNDELNDYLDMVRESMGSLDVITICDTQSIRLYHPEKSRIGQKFVGGDEMDILAGELPYITDGMGTLGSQRRAFHAVKNETGDIIGFVMVSIFTESIRVVRNRIFLIHGGAAVFLLAFGLIAAHHTMNYLKHLLMGYKPEEFVTKYVERSEVLDALDEGIFAVDPQGKVIMMNQSAKEMLGLDLDKPVEGENLKQLYPETKLLDAMESGKPEYNMTMVLNGNHILTNRIPIKENNQIAGAISIFRNKTEVMKMAEELTGARYMLDTLRAFNHEFMNKLHVILGYVQLGDNETAIQYITNTTLVSSQAVKDVTNQISVSRLSALIIGKMMRASELGIHLVLKNDSHCKKEHLLLPMDGYVTVIGNLIENAIEELNSQDYPIKEVELGVYCESGCSIITCEDTGGGIPELIREHIYDQGCSVKGEGRGTGLALIKDLTERYHGDIAIETEAGEGTCITVSFIA